MSYPQSSNSLWKSCGKPRIKVYNYYIIERKFEVKMQGVKGTGSKNLIIGVKAISKLSNLAPQTIYNQIKMLQSKGIVKKILKGRPPNRHRYIVADPIILNEWIKQRMQDRVSKEFKDCKISTTH